MQNKQTYSIADSADPEEAHQVQLQAPSPGPERILLSEEIRKRVAQAMGFLTPAERVAFTMRHMEGQSIEEISQVLNVKAGAAKNCVFRAVQKLRLQLEPLSGGAQSRLQGCGGSALK